MTLLWVTHAKRPLYMSELQDALATEYDIGSFNIGRFNFESAPERNVILASACGLVTVDADNTVRLIRKCVLSC